MRKIIPHPFCALCDSQVETTEHLLLTCPWTEQIWTDWRLSALTPPSNSTRIETWLHEQIRNPSTSPLFEGTAALLWCIWKARNNAVFRGKVPCADTLTYEAEALVRSYRSLNGKDRSISETSAEIPQKWTPPTQSDLKLNIDASVGGVPGVGAVAGVLRDAKGLLLDGFVGKIRACSPYRAEAWALREALKFLEQGKQKGRSREMGKVIIESDCCTLVEEVNGETVIRWDSEDLIIEAQ
ncbi:uncharacterized protein J3R85_006087 [Psidium guajava]|nr:uncharacterized protein J3R85_006087 [Psidium guajava]